MSLGSYLRTICVGLIVTGFGCASVSPQVSSTEAKTKALVFDLNAIEAAISQGDYDGARTLIEADLEARKYMQSYDAIQMLRMVEPNSTENLNLLAEACFGVGLFDEAAASYYGIYQADSRNISAMLNVVDLLLDRGDRARARQLLEPNMKSVGGLYPVQLLMRTTDNVEEQLAWIDNYLAQNPKDEEALATRQSVLNHQEMGGSIRIVEGQGKVARTRLSERYVATVKINGNNVRLLFDTGASGVLLGAKAALRVGVSEIVETKVWGLGGGGGGIAYNTLVGTLQIGEVVLADVPALVVNEMTSNYGYSDGIIGPDAFPNWAYLMDRKGEVLELYPPEMEPPALAANAAVMRYHTVGHHIIIDAAIQNRVNEQGWQVKMLFDTGASNTLYNMSYAKQLEFGEINSTETVPFVGLSGYTKAIQVNRSEVHFAGARFEFPSFWAIDDFNRFRFVPYGLLGRDIISRYKILIDPKTHQSSFEIY